MFSAFHKREAAPEPAPAAPAAQESDQSSRIAELEKKLTEAREEVIALSATVREIASRAAKEDPRLEELEKRLRAEEERTASLSAFLWESFQAQEAAQREVEQLEEKLVYLASLAEQPMPKSLDCAPRTQEEDPGLEELEKRLSAEKERTGALSETLRDEALRVAASYFDNAVEELARKRYVQASRDLAASRKLWKLS